MKISYLKLCPHLTLMQIHLNVCDKGEKKFAKEGQEQERRKALDYDHFGSNLLRYFYSNWKKRREAIWLDLPPHETDDIALGGSPNHCILKRQKGGGDIKSIHSLLSYLPINFNSLFFLCFSYKGNTKKKLIVHTLWFFILSCISWILANGRGEKPWGGVEGVYVLCFLEASTALK